MRLTNCTSRAMNEIRKGKLFFQLGDGEVRNGGVESIDRGERLIRRPERVGRFSFVELSLLFTVDNDLESGRGLKTLLSFHLLVPAKLNYRRR